VAVSGGNRKYLEKTTDLSQVTDKLEVFITATIVRLSWNISSSIIFVPNGRNNDISNVIVCVPYVTFSMCLANVGGYLVNVYLFLLTTVPL
jgi:hypothetical protein